MKTRKLKIFALALLLPLLTGCELIHNFICGIALNIAFNAPELLNKINVVEGGANVTPMEEKPTSADKRASLTYGVEALVLPKRIETVQYGYNIVIDFTFTFSDGAEDYFYIKDVEDAEQGEYNVDGTILYPTGTVEKPESIDAISDWLTVWRMYDLKNQDSKDITITLTGKSRNKTKSQTYYFNLNGDLITLPEGGDVDVERDYALVVQQVDTPTYLDVNIPKAELVVGSTIPLKVMWVDFLREEGNGTLTITIETDLSADYDVTLPPAGNTYSVTVNETLIDYPVLVKLKLGHPVPENDLIIRFKAIVTM
ncbi:MAG: hypothetical protein BWX74_00547 [Tenericutes bacterium ADurb.Bin087]|nr:MAG: hypothetical protein BWX74_00547 [Tenericutes bacterium ADurb.Bin087]